MRTLSKEYLDSLAARTSLDCGGYSWDDGEAYGLPGIAVTDGDTEYFLGADAIPRKWAHGSLAFLAFAEDAPEHEFPAQLVNGDGDTFARRATGEEYGVDRECDWCGCGTGNEDCRPGCVHQPDGGEGAAGGREHCRLACTRCEGTGYQDCPGGAWAWYTLLQSDEDRSEQQWRRAHLALAIQLIADSYHSGQSSKGYAKSCQADRVLKSLQFRPGAGFDASKDEEIRSIAADYLWRHRRTVARRW